MKSNGDMVYSVGRIVEEGLSLWKDGKSFHGGMKYGVLDGVQMVLVQELFSGGMEDHVGGRTPDGYNEIICC